MDAVAQQQLSQAADALAQQQRNQAAFRAMMRIAHERGVQVIAAIWDHIYRGGVQGGVSHGSTDPTGAEAVDGVMDIHDWHATVLHLSGLDHERLTYRFQGRDFRLTDVHGNVVKPILA